MRFQLTDDQRALRDAVRSFLRDKAGPTQLRAAYDDPSGDGVPAGLWEAFGAQGWLAVLVPEAHDGLGLGLLDASVLARCFGASTTPGPWQSTVLLGEAVRLYGSDEQRKDLLPRLAAGELTGAVALLKPGASPTCAGAPVTAEGDRLSGRLAMVDYAATADVLLVAAQDGLYLVDLAGEPGTVTITEHQALDRTTRQADVVLDGTTAERLDGSADWQELLDRAAVLAANDLVGIARTALSDTVEYDKTRVQFGKPVGSFQALQHALADVHLTVTMAEHAALYAAHALDEGFEDAPLAASVAKAKAGVAAEQATSAMVQFHGGIGFTWEHHTHFYLKRGQRLAHAFGDTSQHLERVARLAIDA